MAPILGYWKIRGFGQPIRLMFAYTETELEEKVYNYGPREKKPYYHWPPPEVFNSDWYKERNSLGLAFPNLPYYIEGDLKISQSLAIMRYLARKFDLVPDSEEGRIRADMVEQQAADFRSALARTFYNPDFEKLKDEYLKNLPSQIKAFSDFLGERKWFAGDKLTYVDFLVYEALDHHRLFALGCVDDFQNLKDFLHRFENLPTIQKYMKSENFLDWPLGGDMGRFGSRFHPKPKQ